MLSPRLSVKWEPESWLVVPAKTGILSTVRLRLLTLHSDSPPLCSRTRVRDHGLTDKIRLGQKDWPTPCWLVQGSQTHLVWLMGLEAKDQRHSPGSGLCSWSSISLNTRPTCGWSPYF